MAPFFSGCSEVSELDVLRGLCCLFYALIRFFICFCLSRIGREILLPGYELMILALLSKHWCGLPGGWAAFQTDQMWYDCLLRCVVWGHCVCHPEFAQFARPCFFWPPFTVSWINDVHGITLFTKLAKVDIRPILYPIGLRLYADIHSIVLHKLN